MQTIKKFIICSLSFIGAFVSPLDTYDSLLNSSLIFSPLNYNNIIVHLMTYHLRPLSLFNSFVDNVLCKGNKLSLIASMTVFKFQQNFDIISIDSLTDYLQLLSKPNGIDFETLLANILVYSNVKPTNLPLTWLQSIFDLVKHNQFKSSNSQCFVLVTCK